jgi:hypothetical protein
MRRRRFQTLAAVFAGLLAGASLTAIGHAAGDSTPIHACVHTSNGAVRIVSPATQCRANEYPLDWSIQGPPGQATGHVSGGGFGMEQVDPDWTVVETLHGLPPGTYLATATAALASDSRSPLQAAQCQLQIPGVWGGQDHQASIGGSAGTFAVVPLIAGFTIETTQDLLLVCRATYEGVVTQQSVISAIPVTTLTVDSS